MSSQTGENTYQPEDNIQMSMPSEVRMLVHVMHSRSMYVCICYANRRITFEYVTRPHPDFIRIQNLCHPVRRTEHRNTVTAISIVFALSCCSPWLFLSNARAAGDLTPTHRRSLRWVPMAFNGRARFLWTFLLGATIFKPPCKVIF